MTIYIWDNGSMYSDHCIKFIESDLDRAGVITLLNLVASADTDQGGCVGVVMDVDWLRVGATMPLAEFVTDGWEFGARGNISWVHKLPAVFWRSLKASLDTPAAMHLEYILGQEDPNDY